MLVMGADDFGAGEDGCGLERLGASRPIRITSCLMGLCCQQEE